MAKFRQMTIGERLRWLLVVRRLTQQGLASKIGITQGAVSNIVGSASRQPTARTLLKMADALECSAEFILLGEGSLFEQVAPRNAREAELLCLYRSLQSTEQSTLMVFARILARSK
ncbi:helix-turn-helix domain-containing protein [Xanthomonas campestris pv. phormiicola]|nr:helix-turn-helix domain-containing protein [Xanthomonas campestris pv. phormiicola]UYC14901.1 helix-turn-helix domain-containing protein [Xanthomonas campestris pv. phormiicola]